MPVPYLAGALRGWTQVRNVQLITQTVVNHQIQESDPAPITLDMNLQPVPPQQVARRPEDQRQWKWWSVIVREGPLLNIDDVLIVDSIRYRIQKVHNWSESGFQKYEAHEDYGT